MARLAQKQAANLLWQMLCRDGPYRNKWQLRARRDLLDVVHGEVHSEAVRRVLVDHLVGAGELSDPDCGSNAGRRPWKDQVSGVRTGTRLTFRTLEIFIAAFNISKEEADRLRDVHSGELTV